MSMQVYGGLSGDLGQFTSENGVLQHKASNTWTPVTNAVIKASGNVKHSAPTELTAAGSDIRILAMRFHSKAHGSIRITFEAKINTSGTNYITLLGGITSSGVPSSIRSNPVLTSAFVNIDAIPIGSSIEPWSSSRYVVVNTGVLTTSYASFTLEIVTQPGSSYYLVMEPGTITQNIRNITVGYDYLTQETFG